MKRPNYLNGFGKDVCTHCGLSRTKEGHDGCIRTLDGVMNACCGHGDESAAYVQFDHPNYTNNPNKVRIEGKEAVDYIKKHRQL